MVSWQAFSSLPPRAPTRVPLAPKTPFAIPLKRLPRRLGQTKIALTSEERQQKFHTDDVHHPDLGSVL